jgi:hypothetical protein
MRDRAAIEKTIAAIRAGAAGEPANVRMRGYVNICGTPACVAGWACFAAKTRMDPYDDYFQRGRAFLGLSYYQARDLFLMGSGQYAQIAAFDELSAPVRRDAAINVLQGLRDTNKVDWTSAIRKAGGTWPDLVTQQAPPPASDPDVDSYDPDADG